MAKNHNKFNNKFNEIISLENLEFAYYRTQKSKSKYKKDSILFSFNLFNNLESIKNELINKTYVPENYNTFIVYEPKERIISAPKFKDKVVQFAIHNILNPEFEKNFIYDSYACINHKGTHKAALRIQDFLKESNNIYNNPYIIKIDIKKFFYSIDRNILKELLKKNIKCKNTLNLLFKIIDTSPGINGLPLGNCTSQLFANIYLNELDQYCKRSLGLKYYVRYMDDIAIIIDEKDNAKIILEDLIDFINKKLNLDINIKKTKIFPLKQGINMVGYKIYLTHMKLRNSSKKRIKRKIKKMEKLISNGELSKEKVEQIISSWLGHAKHANSENFINSLLKRYPYIKINKKGKVRVNVNNKTAWARSNNTYKRN